MVLDTSYSCIAIHNLQLSRTRINPSSVPNSSGLLPRKSQILYGYLPQPLNQTARAKSPWRDAAYARHGELTGQAESAEQETWHTCWGGQIACVKLAVTQRRVRTAWRVNGSSRTRRIRGIVYFCWWCNLTILGYLIIWLFLLLWWNTRSSLLLSLRPNCRLKQQQQQQ